MKKIIFGICAILFIFLSSESGCEKQATSRSGINVATTKVTTDLNGKTIEQNNIINRLTEDNKPGSIKHLYVISAYSGQVLIYSTVKGKVTSSGKRLSPTRMDTGDNFLINGVTGSSGSLCYTKEILSDDGTYGNSTDYIYWWDSKGIYHQQYITGGMILHISNQPLAVKGIILNMETSTLEQ